MALTCLAWHLECTTDLYAGLQFRSGGGSSAAASGGELAGGKRRPKLTIDTETAGKGASGGVSAAHQSAVLDDVVAAALRVGEFLFLQKRAEPDATDRELVDALLARGRLLLGLVPAVRAWSSPSHAASSPGASAVYAPFSLVATPMPSPAICRTSFPMPFS